jgi:hypothetical protein
MCCVCRRVRRRRSRSRYTGLRIYRSSVQFAAGMGGTGKERRTFNTTYHCRAVQDQRRWWELEVLSRGPAAGRAAGICPAEVVYSAKRRCPEGLPLSPRLRSARQCFADASCGVSRLVRDLSAHNAIARKKTRGELSEPCAVIDYHEQGKR